MLTLVGWAVELQTKRSVKRCKLRETGADPGKAAQVLRDEKAGDCGNAANELRLREGGTEVSAAPPTSQHHLSQGTPPPNEATLSDFCGERTSSPACLLHPGKRV